MSVKKLTAEHIEEIHHIDMESFAHPWSQDTLSTMLISDKVCCFGYFEDDMMVGYVALEWILDEGSITNLAVLRSHRRRGIAEELVRTALGFSRETGLVSVTLEVRVSNLPAVSLYRKLSFAEVGKRPGYYTAPVEDALLMTHFISK